MGRRSTRRIYLNRAIAFACASVLSACSPQTSAETTPSNEPAQSASHPVSGLRVVPLTVTGAAGTHRFDVEVADTDQAQQQGLMFRTELPDDEGMIFPYEGITAQSFWMKNTPLALDIIFVGPNGTISNIAAMTTPYSLDPVYSIGPVLAVLELRGGLAAELGIVPGDKVEW